MHKCNCRPDAIMTGITYTCPDCMITIPVFPKDNV